MMGLLILYICQYGKTRHKYCIISEGYMNRTKMAHAEMVQEPIISILNEVQTFMYWSAQLCTSGKRV
jgi:hypothetical protein